MTSLSCAFLSYSVSPRTASLTKIWKHICGSTEQSTVRVQRCLSFCSLSPPLHLVFRQSNKSILLWQHAAYTSNLLFRQPFLIQTFSPSPMPASCGLLQTDSMLSKGHWVHSALALMSYLAHWWCNRTCPRQSRSVTRTNWVLAENSSICPRGT